MKGRCLQYSLSLRACISIGFSVCEYTGSTTWCFSIEGVRLPMIAERNCLGARKLIGNISTYCMFVVLWNLLRQVAVKVENEDFLASVQRPRSGRQYSLTNGILPFDNHPLSVFPRKLYIRIKFRVVYLSQFCFFRLVTCSSLRFSFISTFLTLPDKLHSMENVIA